MKKYMKPETLVIATDLSAMLAASGTVTGNEYMEGSIGVSDEALGDKTLD